MRFVQKINQKKFILISFFLFIYVVLNILDGERGLISYFAKQKIKNQFIEEKKSLTNQLAFIEKKNMLLTDKIDLDYIEILYRQKFMLGKPTEQIYKID